MNMQRVDAARMLPLSKRSRSQGGGRIHKLKRATTSRLSIPVSLSDAIASWNSSMSINPEAAAVGEEATLSKPCSARAWCAESQVR